ETITAVATALFARQGFAQTTTAQIANEAGISPGSLFYYFPDQASIFRAIFEQDIPLSRAVFAEHSETDDPASALLDVVSTFATPACDEFAPGLMVELLRQVGNDPHLMEIVATNDAILQEGLTALLRQAIAEGQADCTLDVEQSAAWIRTI